MAFLNLVSADLNDLHKMLSLYLLNKTGWALKSVPFSLNARLIKVVGDFSVTLYLSYSGDYMVQYAACMLTLRTHSPGK